METARVVHVANGGLGITDGFDLLDYPSIADMQIAGSQLVVTDEAKIDALAADLMHETLAAGNNDDSLLDPLLPTSDGDVVPPRQSSPRARGGSMLSAVGSYGQGQSASHHSHSRQHAGRPLASCGSDSRPMKAGTSTATACSSALPPSSQQLGSAPSASATSAPMSIVPVPAVPGQDEQWENDHEHSDQVSPDSAVCVSAALRDPKTVLKDHRHGPHLPTILEYFSFDSVLQGAGEVPMYEDTDASLGLFGSVSQLPSFVSAAATSMPATTTAAASLVSRSQQQPASTFTSPYASTDVLVPSSTRSSTGSQSDEARVLTRTAAASCTRTPTRTRAAAAKACFTSTPHQANVIPPVECEEMSLSSMPYGALNVPSLYSPLLMSPQPTFLSMSLNASVRRTSSERIGAEPTMRSGISRKRAEEQEEDDEEEEGEGEEEEEDEEEEEGDEEDTVKTASDEDCTTPSQGSLTRHYQQQRRDGVPLSTSLPSSLLTTSTRSRRGRGTKYVFDGIAPPPLPLVAITNVHSIKSIPFTQASRSISLTTLSQAGATASVSSPASTTTTTGLGQRQRRQPTLMPMASTRFPFPPAGALFPTTPSSLLEPPAASPSNSPFGSTASLTPADVNADDDWSPSSEQQQQQPQQKQQQQRSKRKKTSKKKKMCELTPEQQAVMREKNRRQSEKTRQNLRHQEELALRRAADLGVENDHLRMQRDELLARHAELVRDVRERHGGVWSVSE